MKNYLIIGGAGFVGSALCKHLSKNHNVVSLDNYFTGTEANHHDNVTYVHGDAANVQQCVGNLQFDYIFHLGEYARVEQSYEDFDTVIEYNYHSFPKVLEFAKRQNAKLVYSGSSTKFAIGDEKGMNMSPYAYTKAQNTELLKNYADWYGLDYTIVYFYNVYGDHEIGSGKYATVIAKFLQLVKEGHKTLPVTAPGTQLRNFTHIDDIVSGLVLAADRGNGDGYGIGCDKKWSMIEVVDAMGVDYQVVESKRGNRMDGQLHTDKLRALGWKAEKDLGDYINTKLGKDSNKVVDLVREKYVQI